MTTLYALPDDVPPVADRISRADEHIEKIADLTGDWSMSGPITPEQQRRSDGRIRVIVKSFTPPPAEIRLLASEAIHHMRTALDNVLWDVVTKTGLVLTGRQERQIQVPYAEDRETLITRSKGKPRVLRFGHEIFERCAALLPDADPTRVPSLGRSLPVLLGTESEDIHPLTLLNGYSNEDKHRVPVVTAGCQLGDRWDQPFFGQDRAIKEVGEGTVLVEFQEGEPVLYESSAGVFMRRPAPSKEITPVASELGRIWRWIVLYAIPKLLSPTEDSGHISPPSVTIDAAPFVPVDLLGGRERDGLARAATLHEEKLRRAATNLPLMPEMVDVEWE